MELNQLEGAGIIKHNNLLVQVCFFKSGVIHGYCITYEKGVAVSIQLYEDGDLIKETKDIIQINKGTDIELPDDVDEDGNAMMNRKVNGFVVDNKILEGSYGVHSYVDPDKEKKFIDEGIFKQERLHGMGKRDEDDG